MRWGLYTVALLATLLLAGSVRWVLHLSWLDPFLVLVLLCGLLAPVRDARLAAWIAGLVHDLSSGDPLGIHAFTLGLTGLLLTRLREALNIEPWWARGVACALAAWAGQLLYLIHHAYWTAAGGLSWVRIVGESWMTATVAGVIVIPLTGLPRLFSRRRRAGGAKVG